MHTLSYIAFFLRIFGDAAHVASMVMLVKKVQKTKSFSGLSYKTQLLKLIVFITRYLDIFGTNYTKFTFSYSKSLWLYNTFMKIAYIAFQSTLVYAIRFKYFHTYDAELDEFKAEILVIMSLILAFFINIFQGSFSLIALLYNFSILLESVAILPQLIQLQKMQESETLTSKYILLLGAYRLLYLLNWLIKKMHGDEIYELLLATGILQTLLYAHFFILFYGYVVKMHGFKRIPK